MTKQQQSYDVTAARAARKPWTIPGLTVIPAEEAENSANPLANDGPFSSGS